MDLVECCQLPYPTKLVGYVSAVDALHMSFSAEQGENGVLRGAACNPSVGLIGMIKLYSTSIIILYSDIALVCVFYQ